MESPCLRSTLESQGVKWRLREVSGEVRMGVSQSGAGNGRSTRLEKEEAELAC